MVSNGPVSLGKVQRSLDAGHTSSPEGTRPCFFSLSTDNAAPSGRTTGLCAGGSDPCARAGARSHPAPPGQRILRRGFRKTLCKAETRRGLPVCLRLRAALDLAFVAPETESRTQRRRGARVDIGIGANVSASTGAGSAFGARAGGQCLGRLFEGDDTHPAGAALPWSLASRRARERNPPLCGHLPDTRAHRVRRAIA